MTAPLNVLLLAADSGDGQFTRLLDPQLATSWAEHGICVREVFVSRLTDSDLAAAQVVILMRTPVPGHPKGDESVFADQRSSLERFVRTGGGLILMFAESYGKTVAALNAFASIFDIRFVFNRIEEAAPDRRSHLPNMPDGELITVNLEPDAPFGRGGQALDLLVTGGHGTQLLSCLPGPDWQTVMRGSMTCSSTPYPANHYAGAGTARIERPCFSTIRTYGQGRIVAFPNSSPAWIANACLPRWQSHLLTQHNGHGRQFLLDMLRWAADGKPYPGPAPATNPLADPDEFSFLYLSERQQQEFLTLRPYRLWLVECTTNDYAQLARTATEQGISVVLPIVPYDTQTPDSWLALHEELAKLGQAHGIVMAPAYRQLDEEGMNTVVFNVDTLPDQRRQYPNSNLLEDLLVKRNHYTAVLATPSENRMPPWRFGGYNAMEIRSQEDLTLYRARVASQQMLGPLTTENAPPADEIWQNWVLAASLDKALDAVAENRHFSIVTSGPVLQQFGLYGPRLVDDDWEGLWYEWSQPDEVLHLHLALTSSAPLTQITVWDGENVLVEFKPNDLDFRTCYDFPASHDRRLHVTAEDAAGGRLIASYPVFSRNRGFWGHVGSDQMNDYHNLWIDAPHGPVGIGDRLCDAAGFVTCGYAWGDYVRVTPATPWSDIMPQGMEVSSLAGNFQSLHPSPLLRLAKGKFDILNDHERSSGPCSADLHLINSNATGAWLSNSGSYTWTGHGNRVFAPTRYHLESELWRSEATYRLPRWQAGGPIIVEIRQTLEWIGPYTFVPDGSFTLCHLLHLWKDDLSWRSVDATHEETSLPLAHLALPANTATANKDWDTEPVLDLLRRPPQDEPRLPMSAGGWLATSGDPMGNVAIHDRGLPGSCFLRAWRFAPGRWLSAIELQPSSTSFIAGDRLDLAYDLVVYPGEAHAL